MQEIEILWHLIEQGRKGNNIGTSTGLFKLDKIIGGIQPSRYYLCSAASSAGKSSLIMFMIYNILKQNTKDTPTYFIWFSLEIGSEVLLAKLMALYCAEEFGIYLTINDILSFDEKLDDESYQYLKKAKDWLLSVKDYLHILDKALSSKVLYKETLQFVSKHGTIEEIEGKSRFIPNNPKQKIIGVIDHISLLMSTEGRSLKEEIDLTSSYIVSIKRKYQVSWFVLAQQNRESSSMDRRKADLSEPGLSDVKDSGNTVQDADVVLQLFYPFREKLSTYRDYKILGDNGLRDAFRSIIISKNRYGVANQVIGCSFYGSVGWFNELPPGKEITDFYKYQDEATNIPCKIKREIQIKDEQVVQKEQPAQISFKF